VLDHLINFEPLVEAHPGATPLDKLTPVEHANAQITTSDWLKAMGAKDDEEITNEVDKQHARQAFAALTTNTPAPEQHQALATLETPAAVRHLTGMLTAYDWEFVNQAKELRGYAVAKILEDCEHSNPNIRLKALGLLGKVTEVGLFTEKIEVKKTDLTEAEIDAKLKEKLAKFMDVQDADVIDVTPKTQDEVDVDPDNPDAD
jgi:hypothetical protein